MNETICIDFDGVIHSYTSRWEGPETIPDPPVDGAFDAIKTYLAAGYKVCILSTRNYQTNGPLCMVEWFEKYGFDRELLYRVSFPTYKPPAILYIDDRGYHFKGTFPDVEFIENFKPWNKKS